MRLIILFQFFYGLLITSAFTRKETGVRDIVDHVTRFVLGPLSRDVFCVIEISRNGLSSLDDLPEVNCMQVAIPENLFRVDSTVEESEESFEVLETSSTIDLKVESETAETLSLDSHSTASSEASESSTSSFDETERISSYSPVKTTNDALVESSTELTNHYEVVELTKKYHQMRVNYTHTIQAKDKIIMELEKTIRDLQSEVNKMRDDRMSVTNNDDCEVKLKALQSDLTMTRKFVDMRKYSKALRRKLKEYQAFEDTKK